MFVLRALVVWLVIIAVETVHGVLRNLLLAPIMGDFHARQISVFTGSLLIFGVTLFLISWIGARTRYQLLIIGSIWVLLTILFEITLGRLVLNLSWDRITEDYNITRGGLLGFGLLFMAVSPLLAYVDANSPPVAVANSYAIGEDQLLTISAPGILGNDTDPNNDPLTAQVQTTTTNGLLQWNANGSFDYRPNANFAGTDTFTYKAVDAKGALSGVATVTITVTPINDAPIANPDQYTVASGLVLNVPASGLLLNDVDIENQALLVASYTQTANGTLTVNVNGSFVYTPAPGFSGTDTFSYRATDGSATSTLALVTIVVTPGQIPAKFFIPDQSEHETFMYGASGQFAGRFDHYSTKQRSRGAASNADGSKLWIVSAERDINVYTGTGVYLGSWNSKAGNQPEDIATNGTDIWIVDDARDQVFFFAGGAAWTSGSQSNTSAFNLRRVNGNPEETNGNPSGMVFRDGKLWITDRRDGNTSRVFVYQVDGTYLGRWNLDPANNDPSGITLNPTTGSDMWVVDRFDSKVYVYPGATTWLSGNRTASGSWSLHPSNQFAEGIADPPVIVTGQPTTGATLTQGEIYLVSGNVSSSSSEVTTVTVEGQPAATVDVAGNFFQPVQAITTTSPISISATDLAGATTSSAVNVTVTNPTRYNNIDFSITTPAASTGLLPEYGRTSFNEQSRVLFVDLTVNNQRNYSLSGPILVGVKNISDPRVRLRNADGISPEGIPYYDITTLVTGDYFPAKASSGLFTLEFVNPDQMQFDYDLVVFGATNHAPRFITAPTVSVTAGQEYRYDSRATDPDKDALTYRLISGPGDLAIDSSTGNVRWTTTQADVGNHTVWIAVTDGRGGVDRQSYIVSVLSSLPNRPPVWVSSPVVDAQVGSEYFYDGKATDPDNDVLSYSVESGPTGLTIDAKGDVRWTPTDQYAGQLVPVRLLVQDGRGGSALQSYEIYVQPSPLNRPPVIVSTPQLTHQVSAFPNPSSGCTPELVAATTGVFTNNGDYFGMNRHGIVITTGNAKEYSSGPNRSSGFSQAYSGATSDPTQIGLLAPISGSQYPYFDVTQIDIDFDLAAGKDAVSFNVVFGSDEFREYVGSEFLDAFGLYVNNQNIAFSAGDPININHQDFQFVDGTESDGILVPNSGIAGSLLPKTTNSVMSFTKQLTAGSSGNKLTFIIADTSDAIYDTTAYISGLGATTLQPIDVRLESSPLGKPVTATPTIRTGLMPGDTATFNTTISSTGIAHSFDLHLVNNATNQLLGSIPVSINSGYFYLVKAVDPDGDNITYRLTEAPDGATMDPQTALISWAPPAAGHYRFGIEVSDGRGGFDVQVFDLVVSQLGAGNLPPVLSAIPSVTTQVARPVQIQATATDPEGGLVKYYLTSSPAGMTIDSFTGLINWYPPLGQELLPPQNVTVKVFDRNGASDTKSFTITTQSRNVIYNTSPTIVSKPKTLAAVGQAYVYDVDATDPNNDAITYALSSGPEGMAIDPVTGRIGWKPTLSQEGDYNVFVTANRP